MSKPSICKVENPMYLKIEVDHKTFITCGSPKKISDSFGMQGVPPILSAFPNLVKTRLRADSVTAISPQEFETLYSRIADPVNPVVLL